MGGWAFSYGEIPLCIDRGANRKVVLACGDELYRGIALIRNTPLLGPYGRTIPRVIWWS